MIGRIHVWRILPFASGVAAALAGLSCDESLPPRESLPTVLASRMSIVSPGESVVIRGGAPTGTRGAIELRVTNVYDEVLQDSFVLEGRAEIWLKNNPEVRAEIPLTIDHVVTTGLFRGRLLTIGTDTTMIMRRQWSHRTDDGVPFWDYLTLVPKTTMGGEPFCQSDTATFMARCSLRIFKSYGQVQFPDLEFRQVYQVFGIECPAKTE